MLGLAPSAALAQQSTAAAIQPPPPKPPPPPRPGERRPHPGWLYRGIVAVAGPLDLAGEIDTPVTGFGNEALWDIPPLPPLPVKVAVRTETEK